MKTIIPDSNVFLRFLLNDIPEQKKLAEKLLTQAKNKEASLLVPQIVIFEIDFILEKYYLFSKKEVVERLKSLISTDYIEIESKEAFGEALKIYEKQPISFVDCFLIARARLEEVELFTFDQKLSKLATTTTR